MFIEIKRKKPHVFNIDKFVQISTEKIMDNFVQISTEKFMHKPIKP